MSCCDKVLSRKRATDGHNISTRIIWGGRSLTSPRGAQLRQLLPQLLQLLRDWRQLVSRKWPLHHLVDMFLLQGIRQLWKGIYQDRLQIKFPLDTNVYGRMVSMKAVWKCSNPLAQTQAFMKVLLVNLFKNWRFAFEKCHFTQKKLVMLSKSDGILKTQGVLIWSGFF